MIPDYVWQLGNHLWQSTLFAAIAWLLTFLLRKNRAQLRHWLWLSASLKFLIPFSLLVSIGSHLDLSGWTSAASTQTQPLLTTAIKDVFAPSTLSVAVPAVEPPEVSPIPALLLTAWTVGFMVVLFSWWRQWRRVRTAVRIAMPLYLDAPIEAVSSLVLLEPGVFGIRRPVLILPEGIKDRLTPPQLDAIIAHELCHVRRRDNLVAALHMAVEAVFWFYPLVWWLGRRIVEERERACDEEVLRLGGEPEVYAEGILKVCEFYLESPLVCMAGVSGSNLRKRIRAIMTHHGAKKLQLSKKLLLAAIGMLAVAGPMIIGVMNTPQVRAQSQPATPLAFEVASVKPNNSGGIYYKHVRMEFLPGGRLIATNLPLQIIITIAYHLPFQSAQLSGGPDWIRSERYDIEATAEKEVIPAGSTAEVRAEKMRLMLQTLLADRFKLVMRRETKELPVYVLVVGKNGPKLPKAKIEEKDCTDGPATEGVSCHSFTVVKDEVSTERRLRCQTWRCLSGTGRTVPWLIGPASKDSSISKLRAGNHCAQECPAPQGRNPPQRI